MRRASAEGRRNRRGFTLIELMIAVAIIGVLSALALVGYKKYVNSSQASEATANLSAIRAAEEAYRAETLSYLGCSTDLNTWYPNTTPNSKKMNWNNPSHADYAKWLTLNVANDGPVRFGYAVVNGDAGNSSFPTTKLSPALTYPTKMSADPWYVAQAVADRDENSVYAVFVTTSYSGEVFSQNTAE